MDKRTMRMAALRQKMDEAGIDAYVVSCGDYHGSEYYSDYFCTLQAMSGFTGESSLLVIGKTQSALWVDGRFFLQGALELEGTEIRLMRMGLPGVPTVTAYLKELLPEGGCLGFDGRVITLRQAGEWQKALAEKQVRLAATRDLVGEVWEDRPAQVFAPLFALPERVTGESAASKLARVREAVKAAGADAHLITSLDDIAWILNLRGGDVPCNPVFFSFLLLREADGEWFVHRDAVSEEIRLQAEALGLKLREYNEIWTDGNVFAGIRRLLLDPARACCFFRAVLPEQVTIVEAANPSTLMKAVKNRAEQEALRKAQHQDGLAMVRFLYALTHKPDIEAWDEMDAGDYLEQCRREAGAFDLSFPSISAMGTNAAIVHYAPERGKCARLAAEGLYLIDCGGQYPEGTTDITRTVALGPVSERAKFCYTAVLRGMLRLAAAKFPKGCTGYHLDVLARGPLWDAGLDYRHGTGHGVGFCLNVHEGPNAFRWTLPQDVKAMVPLEPGMVTTDEPGYYEEGAFGIRIENDLLCVEDEHSPYGDYYRFETLTLCPIDLTPVLTEQLTQYEKQQLNDYHERVYRELQQDLPEEIRQWLREVTRAI